MSCLNSYLSQKYIKSANLLNDVVYYFAARMRYFPDLCVISLFFVTFARKDNSLRINQLVGLLENWVMR